ncbi:MAG: PLP-dependent aminotransferase family protein [Solobacterium sp.]|nr:PLP-dependent aminotransferase family protein [Solobacterium sp.]
MKRKIPAYLELYQTLRQMITDGAYTFGQRFPSKRSLSAAYSLSLVTVEHAIDLLEEEGYIETRERAGIFVSYCPDTIGSVQEEEPIPHLFSELPSDDAFPYSVIARTIRHVLSEYQEDIMIKSPSSGLPALQNAIASHLLAGRGINVSADQIIIGSGAEYLYGMLVMILGRDKTYGIEDPSYDVIQRIYQANGAALEKLKLGKNGILSHELNSSSADVLHITPFHSYPTGITANVSKRREYIAWADRRNAYLIEDDYDSEFTLSGKPADTLFALADRNNVIYISTFSRTIAPSIRIGFMILPENLLENYRKKAGFFSCPVSTFSQLVLYELIRSGDYERHLNRIRRVRRKIR